MTADEELFAAVRAGRREAFRALFERHRDPAFRLALRVLRHREEAEDAVQEAFLLAFRRARQFRGEARFATWFHRIVLNAALARRRRGARRPGGVPGAGAPLDQLPAAPVARGDAEKLAALERAIDALPEKLRLVFHLVAVEGLAPQAAAEALELAPGTVRHHLFRAREALRRRLGPALDPRPDARAALSGSRR